MGTWLSSLLRWEKDTLVIKDLYDRGCNERQKQSRKRDERGCGVEVVTSSWVGVWYGAGDVLVGYLSRPGRDPPPPNLPTAPAQESLPRDVDQDGGPDVPQLGVLPYELDAWVVVALVFGGDEGGPAEPRSGVGQIAIGQRFSPKKSSAVHEKSNTPRSCLRWKPTGRIFKIAGLRWIPTGKMFTDNTTKVDSEPSNGSNDDITNSYECDQTLNASLFNDKWRLLTTLQAPFLKEKKGVCFSALYLWKKKNLLVFDHSYQHDSCFFHARIVIKWIYYFNPSPSAVQPGLVVVVQEPVVSTGTPSSTRIDEDKPSTSTSQTTQEEQSHVIPTSVEEDDHGIEVALMDNDMQFGLPIPEPSFEESSSQIVIPTYVHTPDPSTLTYDGLSARGHIHQSITKRAVRISTPATCSPEHGLIHIRAPSIQYTMANVNVNAPADQAPAMAPPTPTDDQILLRSR
ncbi:hypothetical protein Tco_0808674 [Tanacetum coccineum]